MSSIAKKTFKRYTKHTMNMRDVDRYIEELSRLGSKPGLGRVRQLCDKLGNPQNDLKFIHVAGTNGKGSTCAFISAILSATKMKIGRFTSPAVMEYRERYWISGRCVSQAALCRNMEIVKSAVDEIIVEGGDSPTLFEIETALAFMIFREAQCEIVVLECGMGGLEDSTNIIPTPLVSVITSISMDHMSFLGKNIEAIAKQKAGIIKKSGHVVTVSQKPEVMNVIKATCSLERADLTIADTESIKNVRWGLKSSSFDHGKLRNLKITMAGLYQTENAVLAITAVEALKKEKIKISEEAIRTGLELAAWPGRFQIISKKPMVILDGAHNEGGIDKLSKSVEYYLHNEIEAGKIIYICGVLADKDYDNTAKVMSPYAAHVITVTPPDNPRALSSQDLALTYSKYHNMVSAAGSLTEALEMAYLLADSDSVILIFGSLSFLGEISRLVDSRGNNLRKKDTRI